MTYIDRFIRFAATLCLFAPLVVAAAQPADDSVRIESCIPVRRADPGKWIRRFQGDIDRYADQNRQMESRRCDVLFIGSSSINLWDNIHGDMDPMSVIRRSYGGSTIRDMIYNYDVIARGYDPRRIVMYVENDFTGGPSDVSVGEAYDLFRLFTGMIRRDYPGTPFYIMSLKPSLVRENVRGKQQMLNALLSDYAASTPGVEFVDITGVMYSSDGELRKDIFKPDNLHINQKGYDLWTAILKPLLMNGLR